MMLLKSAKAFFILVLTMLVVLQCTVQKRHYRSGFYIALKKDPPHQPAPGYNRISPAQADHVASGALVQEVGHLSCSARHGDFLATVKPRITMNTDSCDVLLMRDGTEQKVRVIEISQKEIKYRRCDFADGPLFSVYRNDVFMIRYANGVREVIEQVVVTPTSAVTPSMPGGSQTGPVRKVNDFAALALIVAVISVFVPFPYGAVIAGVALAMALVGGMIIHDNRQRWRGIGYSIVAIAIAILVIGIQILGNVF